MAMANPDSGSGSIAQSTHSEEEFTTVPDIIFGQHISKCTYGTVCVAKHKCDETKLYAVKFCNFKDLEAEDFALIEKEVSNMKLLKHPNILAITASLVNAYHIHIISPLMPMKSINKLVENEDLGFQYGIPEVAIGIIVTDVLQAIVYLHKRKLIHRAIKASHVLLDPFGYAILTGFRYMVERKQRAPLHVDDLNKMTHNLHWLSPEILNQDRGGYTENSDVYSLGMMILEMGNGIAALDTNTPSLMFLKKVGCPSPSLMDMHNTYDQEMQKFETDHRGGGDCDHTGPQMKQTSELEDKRRDFAFMQKEYGYEIKAFVEYCLIKERECRPPIDDMKKTKFVKLYSKASRLQLLSLFGKPIEFETELKLPVSPELSNTSWDFEGFHLNE